MESKVFARALYRAKFAFSSATNPRLLSHFVLTQQVQGCARKGVFQKKHQEFCFEDSFYNVLRCIYCEKSKKKSVYGQFIPINMQIHMNIC